MAADGLEAEETALEIPVSGGLAVRLAFLAVVTATCVRRIGTYDIWWHLSYGRWMLEHRAIPRTDAFSFTVPGVERTNPEWLFQLFAEVLWRLGGTTALVLAKTALVLALAWGVLRFVERQARLSPGAAAVIVLPFFLAGRWRFVERPELLTYAFTALLAATLLRRRRETPGLGQLLWIPGLFALWANVHAGIIVGAGVLGAFTVGRALEGSLGHLRVAPPELGRPTAGQGAILLLTSLGVSLLNPFGVAVWKVPFELAVFHQTVANNLEWEPPRWPVHGLFFATLGIALAMVLSRRRRLDPAALLPFLLLTLLALRYVRNLGLFGCLAPLLLAAALAERRGVAAFAGPLETVLGRVRSSVVAGVLILLALALALGDRPFPAGTSIEPRRLPVAAVDFLETHRPPGKIFNEHAWGGYLLWRTFPPHQVFLDGRDDLYADLRARLGEAVRDSRRWFALLDEYGVDHTLVAYVDRFEEVRRVDDSGRVVEVVRQPWGVTYFPPEEWALVYFDDLAMVHVRRTPENAALIAREGLTNLFPEDLAYQLRSFAEGTASREAAFVELSRVLERNPDSRRAQVLAAAFGVEP